MSPNPIAWDPDFCRLSPLFEPLAASAATLDDAAWPDREKLQRLLTARAVVSGNGRALQLVPTPPTRAAMNYETRAFTLGELETRAENWHDLLNVLTWAVFPLAKARLNARHHAARMSAAAGSSATSPMSDRPSQRRPEVDALTLFDESGIVVAGSDCELTALLRNFQWKQLFWQHRAEVVGRMRFFVFGHGLYEQALRPYTGLTGKAIVIDVAGAFLAEPLHRQVSIVDGQLARHLARADALLHPRELAPLPILGIPGWSADNVHESYYDNTTYFRPGRQGASAAHRSENRKAKSF